MSRPPADANSTSYTGGATNNAPSTSQSYAPAGNEGEKRKGTRGARACVECRRKKKTCEGGAPPCKRCALAGKSASECVFDKPSSSSVVEDAGVSRLAAIEAALVANERRMDTVVQQMGQISTVLSEVLVRLKNQTAATQSPASAFPQVSPFAHLAPFDANSGTPSQPTTSSYPLQHPVPSTSSSATFQPIPPTFPTPPSTSGIAPNPPVFPHRPSRPSFPEPPRRDSFSGLDALASLASSKSPDIHRFASRMGQPISALADAVAQLGDEEREELKPDASTADGGHEADRRGDETQEGRTEEQREGGEPPAKRVKMAIPKAPKVQEHLDLVAKGLIKDSEARMLVALWMKECQPFCSVCDPAYDTYESLRQRSAFLTNAVIYTALRAQERNAPPSKELIAAAEETRRFARNQVFQNPALEDVQAVMVLCCYHNEPYFLSGMGLRLALSARFDTTWAQIEEHGVTKTDEKARRLVAQFRCWIYLLQLEFKHTRYSGRMVIIPQHDFDAAIQQADRLLTLPLTISTDVRHVANLRLVGIERSIMLDTAAMSDDSGLAQRCAYVSEKQAQILNWHAHYDAIISTFEPSLLGWPRKSHRRMFHDANLTLVVSVFKQRLLDRPQAALPELYEIARDGLLHARSDLQTVLGSPVYRDGLQWSGYLLRVDLSFAAIFLLKSAAAYPQLVDRDEVARDVGNLADLLGNLAGSQRYSAMLRAAREQYLARTDPAPPAHADPTASTSPHAGPPAVPGPASAGSPSSASLRSILVPPPPALSAPPAPFGTTAALVPFAPPGSSALGFTPTSAAYAVAPQPPQPGGGTAALLPGEVEFDWSGLAVPSLFDDPAVLLNADWTNVATQPFSSSGWLAGYDAL
ncbi:hypothetical protein JCM10213_007357 [Rhodosporidiobolus nylandii]